MTTKILTLGRIAAISMLLTISLTLKGQFTYKKYTFKNIQPLGEFVPQASDRIFSPTLVPQEMPHPVHEQEKHMRKESGASYDYRSKQASIVQFSSTTPKPEILDTLTGNTYNGSVPNDDDFAIGTNQQLLRVRNTTVGAYDIFKDSLLYELTLFRFYRPFPAIPGSKYDPRALYDPIADRFIVLYLSGTTWQNSKIIAGFSKSNDLADGFNIYQLDGNPLNDSTWSDYPHITISEDDLFITMNTFYNGSTNNSGYVQSTIRQIGLQAGYDSLPLTEHYYANLKYGNRNLFNFTGMDGGVRPQNFPTYFLSSRNLDSINDSIFVAKITGNALGNPQLSLSVYTTENPYGYPPAARQANGHTFDCNDTRIQGGFLQEDRIQFVGNTITPQGNSGIYHGIIDLANPNQQNIYFKILNFDPVDVGYPQITYTGKSWTEVESIITFNHSGDSLNAGFSCIFFDNDSTYSERQQIVEGGDYIDILTNPNRFYERWGDYTGNQPAYGETGTIWANGYESSDRGIPQTALAKLRSPNWDKAAIIGSPENEIKPSSIRPNPTSNWFETELNLKEEGLVQFKLISADGRQNLFQSEEYGYLGVNKFRFRTEHLKSGLYLLQITQKDVVIGQHKVLKP